MRDENGFRQDEEITPVLFRIERRKSDHPEVTAVMPTIPGASDWGTMTCYAHMGQHGSCSMGWYNTTRKATPAEYANLKAELEGAPYGYRFKVYSRLQSAHHEARRAELSRMRNAPGVRGEAA